MKNFYNAISPNKVWILALVVIMAACSQFEAIDPDKTTLEQSADELASAFSLDPYGLENARTTSGGVAGIPGANPDNGGNVNCSGDYEYSSLRIDAEDIVLNNFGGLGIEITIHPDKSISFDVSEFISPIEGECLDNFAFIVKGGSNPALVYSYPAGTLSDSGLFAPGNEGGQISDLSNLTFCYNLEPCTPDDCWADESATGRGHAFTNTRPATWFQWNTRDQLINGVDLVYGSKLEKAGRVNISGVDAEGMRTITVTFDEGFRLAQDAEGNVVSGALKVFASHNAFTQFGGFSGALQSNTASIKVPDTANYFVHADIERKIECPVAD
jgi:hypothetical protein